MKKKTMVIASVLMVAMFATACGNKATEQQPAAGGQDEQQPKQVCFFFCELDIGKREQ